MRFRSRATWERFDPVEDTRLGKGPLGFLVRLQRPNGDIECFGVRPEGLESVAHRRGEFVPYLRRWHYRLACGGLGLEGGNYD